jgi:hypothetical protein
MYVKDFNILNLNFKQIHKTSATYVNISTAQTYELPENGHELRPKHVKVIINKKIEPQVGVAYYT